MPVKNIIAKAASIAAGATLALSAVSGTADAASANISSWTSDGSACNTFYTMCLFYSPGATGGKWTTLSDAVPQIGGTFFGGAGNGRRAYDDAASADNNSLCNVGIWNGINYTGDSDWLSPLKGGNLGPALRNHEKSIGIDDSTRCPGVGVQAGWI